MHAAKKKKGSTLVEVMIALVVISTIVAAYSKMSYTLINTQNKGNIELNALIIAQNEMESIYADTENIKSTSEQTTLLYQNERQYTMEKNIELEDTSSGSSIYNVKVTVSSSEINPVVLCTKIYCLKQ